MGETKTIIIPELSLVLLIGASSAGKSTFARKHFKPTEILSSDFCRGLVSDDENDMDATQAAFDVLHYIAVKRLAARRLVVVDATNLKPEDRKPFVDLAREHHVLPIAIVLEPPQKVCTARNQARPDRDLPRSVIRQHIQQLRRSVRRLEKEGFRYIYRLRSEEEIDSVRIERQRLWTDRRDDSGPFDIIGDLHGCCDELEELLGVLGYVRNEGGIFVHPQGRRAFFLGDLVDRGPRIVDTLELIMGMCETGSALCVPGNHDMKLLRKLRERNDTKKFSHGGHHRRKISETQITHGLSDTLAEWDALPTDEREPFEEKVIAFLDSLVSHFLLDDGKLVVAHAGMKEGMQGRASGSVREFALYGETTGETDEFGLPVRFDWASAYRGRATVVYGHTPVPEPEWFNRTINIDTGCVFGGKLTALRYPEKELVFVPAQRVYSEPVRPFLEPEPGAPQLTAQQSHDDLLNIADYLQKLMIDTRLMGNVVVREENAAAALEVMTRFAIAPQWLIYLPPTMSPSATSRRPNILEHPEEAFSYFQNQGVPQVICEEKHMGSRVVIVLCRDETVALKRFGIIGNGTIQPMSDSDKSPGVNRIEPSIGVCYTRTGRPFFSDSEMEDALLQRLHTAFDAIKFWETHETDWVCLDAELMPWSAKAQELIKEQYAPVGVAGGVALKHAADVLAQSEARGLAVQELQGQIAQRQDSVERYRNAYRQYCWEVTSLDDLKLAPFHLLAVEGKVHTDKDHRWHLETLKGLCDAAPDLFHATAYHVVDVQDEASQGGAIQWWEALTEQGGEGMVVKPYDFHLRGSRGLVQPAVKCRGREYLRIIYGPEYLLPENLDRLKARNLGVKRQLALREFALGIEALERFVRREPLQRVHECVFGVLALESEPVDPRL
jgi:protein phosphatase